jgi:hypothetical protein
MSPKNRSTSALRHLGMISQYRGPIPLLTSSLTLTAAQAREIRPRRTQRKQADKAHVLLEASTTTELLLFFTLFNYIELCCESLSKQLK